MIAEKVDLIQALEAAWNSHDLERILEFYSEDFVLSSPHVKSRMGIAEGTLHGKEQVRQWWQRVLERVPDLNAELISVAEGVDSLAYVFKSSYTQKVVVSVFFFDENGKIKRELYHA